MSLKMPPSPITELSDTDKGDDTQLRYRYQAACAALIALRLLDENSDYQEVYCEQHEDILVYRTDKRFIGIQVKTRQPGKDPFKSIDDEIISAIANFILRDHEYPDSFTKFILGTNYAFWIERKNSSNLQYVLNLAKEYSATTLSEVPSHLQTFLKKISRKLRSNDSTLSHKTIISTLAKVELECEWPKFEDIESRIAWNIQLYVDAGSSYYDDLRRAARSLIGKMLEAAALQKVSVADAYFSLANDPQLDRVRALIQGKRITAEVVLKTIEGAFSDETLLHSALELPTPELPPGINILEAKMIKGRITARNISLTKDLTYSTHRALNDWLYKLGPEKAERQYKHVCTIVRNECHESYDEKHSPTDPFGQSMLVDVRKRLRSKHQQEAKRFFSLSYEHLLGMAGVLTEECEVWWSPEFPLVIEEES